MSEQQKKPSIVGEAIQQIKMLNSYQVMNHGQGVQYVPLPHVLYQLEVAQYREDQVMQLAVSKVLNDLLLSIQRSLNNRDPDQRRNLTMEDVSFAFLSKISEIQSGKM
jgi:hypothetical protein